jgi:sugar phosphate isomerase/epimerase
MHSRVCLHQIALMKESTTAFINLCRDIGVANMTLATPLLLQQRGGIEEVKRALLVNGSPRVAVINHPFAVFPNLEHDCGEASEKLLQAIDLTVSLGAKSMYLLTGGRGALSWEQAAERFAQLLAPSQKAASENGVTLMIENASPFNIDIHITHTLADTIQLAEMTGISVCIDLQPCFGEANLSQLFRRAMPITKLVQVSDYVLGDRVAPCRAVPGDGVVPLERLIGDLLETGYQGLFDLELIGPRINDEGGATASRRAADWLSELLTKLGA